MAKRWTYELVHPCFSQLNARWRFMYFPLLTIILVNFVAGLCRPSLYDGKIHGRFRFSISCRLDIIDQPHCHIIYIYIDIMIYINRQTPCAFYAQGGDLPGSQQSWAKTVIGWPGVDQISMIFGVPKNRGPIPMRNHGFLPSPSLVYWVHCGSSH